MATYAPSPSCTAIYHRLCPACFTKKYVKAEGEGTEVDEEAAVETDSEDSMDDLVIAVILTTFLLSD
jgi:hypothetical protein